MFTVKLTYTFNNGTGHLFHTFGVSRPYQWDALVRYVNRWLLENGFPLNGDMSLTTSW